MSLADVAAELDTALPGAVGRDVPVAELSTYRLGGPVAVLVRVANEAALRAAARVVARERPPVLIVGRGSNLLVADAGFDGVAIVLTDVYETLTLDVSDGTVHAGAAAPLPVVARQAASSGLTGLEFLVGIPGSVGGAVRMNAGGHGREMREVLRAAWIVDLLDDAATERRHDVADLDLGYRSSNLGPTDVVVRAELAAAPAPPADCEARVAEIVRWRREHQPGGPNAGSVFRNPVGDSAGRLIDVTGCKGLRVGGAVVSPKHANFFQAERGATADDVRRLVDEVRARVADATGVELVPELRMVGFDEAGATANGSVR
jgi:UDP-N-acetylmuramate dehydrogenase